MVMEAIAIKVREADKQAREEAEHEQAVKNWKKDTSDLEQFRNATING